ncbi:MAG: redox-regulated ATPase YchF [Halobacteriovoraceae bacterium]|nr:redox-regulated ATPase YchF [Halobacteriovoraceae bacterium]
MGLNCGIVGLPNVGKSTIFKALTSAPADAENYPFCTIEPNVGIVNVKDPRIEKISNLIEPQKKIPAVMEFVDIAGLVKGASKGEGLGNQFLGHIRQVDAIAHVVRCFDDDDIIHVNGVVDPLNDIETIDIELALADLEVVEKKLGNLPKLIKSHDKKVSALAKVLEPTLEKLKNHLENGKPARNLDLTQEEKSDVKDLNLITLKKMIYVCNVKEEELGQDNPHVESIKKYVGDENRVVEICGKIESEISLLETDDEKKEFMEAVGIEESGLHTLTRKAYHMLGLRTYFTAGEKEVRAWTFKSGMTAPEGAGIIHTDFQKGFIKAEVYHCDDLFTFESESKLKEAGKLRIEGKEYLLKDGDVIHFRFNV